MSMQSDSGSSSMATTPETRKARFPEERLQVRIWHDPVLEELGHDPRSPYVERYWLSILGPSATLLLRRLAQRLELEPDGFELDCAAWAQELGIGMRGGKNGPFWRAVDRTCRFGAAQRTGAVLTVRPKLPPLTMHQIARLPEQLQATHQVWLARQLLPVSSKPNRVA